MAFKVILLNFYLLSQYNRSPCIVTIEGNQFQMLNVHLRGVEWYRAGLGVSVVTELNRVLSPTLLPLLADTVRPLHSPHTATFVFQSSRNSLLELCLLFISIFSMNLCKKFDINTVNIYITLLKVWQEERKT